MGKQFIHVIPDDLDGSDALGVIPDKDDDKGDDKGDMTLTGDEWNELKKYVEGLEAKISGGGEVKPSEWQLLKVVKNELDTLGDLPNSQVPLDDFFSGLLQTLISTLNRTIRTTGKIAEDAAAAAVYVPADAPRISQDLAAAVDRLGKLPREELARVIAQGPLYAAEVKPVSKAAEDAEESELVKGTASLLQTIEDRIRRTYAKNAVKLV